jgi:hypothetical protein
LATALLAAAVLALGCAQEKITLPESGGTTTTGACPGSYPGNEADGGAGDAGASYAFEVGETAPCAVFESVRVGEVGAEPNTHINLGELFLQAAHGESDLLEAKWGIDEAKAIVIAASARNCTNCPALIGGLADNQAALEAAGAVMIALCRYELGYYTDDKILTLDEADEILVDEDGWLEEWHRSNDPDKLVPLTEVYPQWFVIRVSDMRVIDFNENDDFEGILSLVQSIDTL